MTIPRIPSLSKNKQKLLNQIVDELSKIEGIAALVLGGSHASGTAHEGSDMDIGLYYDDKSPFRIAEIKRVAEKISLSGSVSVTDFYGWGAWVNGGAWIHTAEGKVDFIYRNLEQVNQTLDDADRGIWQHDYQQQPAYGFYSVTYLAETKICIPLFDPAGIIMALKERVAVYPPKLKQSIIADSLWSVEFTLSHAREFASQGDVFNAVGCLTRASASLSQALFALNETYYLREKKSFNVIDHFSIRPEGYTTQVAAILAHPGSNAVELERSVETMTSVWQSVISLPGVDYTPKFVL